MYEGKPQEELDNYLIKRGEIHTERMQKAEEEKRLAQAKYDNERTYYGQKESDTTNEYGHKYYDAEKIYKTLF